ncbi:MYB DNA-binding domain-containing protein [Xylariales sp. AK1849]|nr:MYB DNA-binding domain-containing protein [Xylariales sp. AK1849]
MAFIEPRLIHLLNESTATPKPHHTELPPIKGLSLPKPNGRPHPLPIGPDASQRSDGTDVNTGNQLASQSLPSFFSVAEDGSTASSLRKEASYGLERNLTHHISSQDLRMILDDTAETADEIPIKKRPAKEDFVQLPQPHQKQKAASQQHTFPPIIVGLLEPPPQDKNAALFPPISSASFDNRARSEPTKALGLGKPPELKPLPEEEAASSPPDVERTPTGRIKRRAAKPRRKWSEEETNHLLLGASKHGVGRWNDILKDPEYKFNDRTAGDLKDRFRTCCPEELKTKVKHGGQHGKSTAVLAGTKPRKGLMSENILNEPEEPADSDNAPSVQNDSDSAPKQRKSRAHRRKLEDLAELGINTKEPFKKSQRRGRRPFSEQDDREILQGFEKYGPHWTRIQRDPKFHLSTRQPTDLRDRLRNKYPEKFSGAEKTAMQVKEPGRGNDLLEPSIDMTIGNSLDKSKSTVLEPQLNRNNSKEDMPKWPFMDTTEYPQAPSNLFWNEAAGAAFPSGGAGEMDISRLLLDDNQVANETSLSDKRGLG